MNIDRFCLWNRSGRLRSSLEKFISIAPLVAEVTAV